MRWQECVLDSASKPLFRIMADETDDKECRICREPIGDNMYIVPCACRGTHKYVCIPCYKELKKRVLTCAACAQPFPNYSGDPVELLQAIVHIGESTQVTLLVGGFIVFATTLWIAMVVTTGWMYTTLPSPLNTLVIVVASHVVNCFLYTLRQVSDAINKMSHNGPEVIVFMRRLLVPSEN